MSYEILQADVPSYKGPCLPTWLSSGSCLSENAIGFFKPVKRGFFGNWRKCGKEFHGKVVKDLNGELIVKSPERL